MRFGTWNVWGLHTAGALKTVARELTTYNLDLVAVQEFRWVKDGSQPAEDHTFFCSKGNANIT